MIGGIQRFTAISRINEKGEGRRITTRKCAVYGSGLSRSASLVLARQHNEFNQIQRTTSFPEMAACCRRLLFSHFAEENEKDDGVTMPVIPRYNTQTYRAFKQECLTFLLSSQVVRIYTLLLCSYNNMIYTCIYMYIYMLLVSTPKAHRVQQWCVICLRMFLVCITCTLLHSKVLVVYMYMHTVYTHM